MNARTLQTTAESVLADDKDLLAMDERTSTCNKRFTAHRIAQTVEPRPTV